METRRPIIGVTTTWMPGEKNRKTFPDGSFDYLKNQYSDWLAEFGGIAFPIPTYEKKHWDCLSTILRKIDGLLLSGGDDLAPDLIGQEEIEGAGVVFHRRRDELELELLRRWELMRKDAPILTICRGHQVLNAFYGGEIIQDFDACGVETIPQRHQTPEKGITLHEVEILPDRLLADILGEGRIRVNSSHHQAVKRVADIFTVSARADDGVIEACELKDKSRWLLSLQWHPEALFEDSSAKIFRAFVEACRG